ncbi:carbamoyltransferase C-terminal domain-containing protein, partial [Pseudomonas sp. 10B1]
GNFYRISPTLKVDLLCEVMQGPGLRYAFAYGIADPTFNLRKGYSRLGDAGKMMALAAFGEAGEPNAEESSVLDYILNCPSPIDTLSKDELKDSSYYNRGVESQEFCNLARKLSDKIFDIFYHAVEGHIQERLPLLIAGGCGLNCEWNRMWEKSGLFDAVFVPPCTNDTGVGIGAAAATQHNLTGKVKIEWSVYSAQSFIYDIPKNSSVFLEKPLCLDEVSETLATGEIVCWVQGNCEIGPRALGNRSIIAAPFSIETTEKLNIIKERERYRPIAPICIEEDAGIYFEGCVKSKYMLSFYNVIDRKLRAVTHIDGTARVQTVTAVDNPAMYDLLSAFKTHSGVGVLCNTSLNFKGRGFINSHSDIEAFCLQNGISTYVINQNMYRKAKAS